jgi:hypothetical protein
MRWRYRPLAMLFASVCVGAAYSTPPLPVEPLPTGVCSEVAISHAPPVDALEFQGTLAGRSIWATAGRFACSEPAFGDTVDCFAGPGRTSVRIQSDKEALAFDLNARESLRIAPEGVSCSAPSDMPSEAISEEPAPDMNDVHAAIAAEAQRLYGAECGQVIVPERAIETVELTGGGHGEYAVFFSRVQCRADGGSTTRWQGSGGAMIQFWLASGGPPRLLLEHSMMGFSPADQFPGLISHQHGGFCPEGAGPNICEVTYHWNDRDRALEVASRIPLESSSEIDRRVRALRFGYDEVSRW